MTDNKVLVWKTRKFELCDESGVVAAVVYENDRVGHAEKRWGWFVIGSPVDGQAPVLTEAMEAAEKAVGSAFKKAPEAA